MALLGLRGVPAGSQRGIVGERMPREGLRLHSAASVSGTPMACPARVPSTPKIEARILALGMRISHTGASSPHWDRNSRSLQSQGDRGLGSGMQRSLTQRCVKRPLTRVVGMEGHACHRPDQGDARGYQRHSVGRLFRSNTGETGLRRMGPGNTKGGLGSRRNGSGCTRRVDRQGAQAPQRTAAVAEGGAATGEPTDGNPGADSPLESARESQGAPPDSHIPTTTSSSHAGNSDSGNGTGSQIPAISSSTGPSVGLKPGTDPGVRPIKGKPFRRNVLLDLALWRISVREFVAARLGDDELQRRALASAALLVLARAGRFVPLHALPLCARLAPAVTAAAVTAPATTAASGGASSAAASVAVAAAAEEARKAEVLRQLLQASSPAEVFGGAAYDPPDMEGTGLVLFSLGIGPYIAASLIMQICLATRLVPYLNLLREQGAQGMEALERIISVMTLALGIVMGILTLVASPVAARKSLGPWGWIGATLWLAVGGVLTRLLTTTITKHGLGDGTSLLVAMDILSGFLTSVGPRLEQAWRGAHPTLPGIHLGPFLGALALWVQQAVQAAWSHLPQLSLPIPASAASGAGAGAGGLAAVAATAAAKGAAGTGAAAAAAATAAATGTGAGIPGATSAAGAVEATLAAVAATSAAAVSAAASAVAAAAGTAAASGAAALTVLSAAGAALSLALSNAATAASTQAGFLQIWILSFPNLAAGFAAGSVAAVLPALQSLYSFLRRREVVLSFAAAASFFVLTASTAALVGAVRRVPLRYFDFDTPAGSLSSSRTRRGGPAGAAEEGEGAGGSATGAVKPHVPFPILPSGMYPLFTASMLASFLGLLLRLLAPGAFTPDSFLTALLQPETVEGQLVLSAIRKAGLAVAVVVLNSASMEDQIKDISDNLLEIGARIPGVRPGTATVAFLRDAQDTARFAGGVLLAVVTIVATLLDEAFLGATGIRPGFPSLLIIVGSVIALRRSVEAHLQIPRLLSVLEANFQATTPSKKG